VDPVAQGEGMGNDLWQALARDHAALFWRTRATNPIANWYATLADGVLRLPGWHVFWRGIPPRAIPDVVDEALARPEDFDP
jgi:acetylglutamate synthase